MTNPAQRPLTFEETLRELHGMIGRMVFVAVGDVRDVQAVGVLRGTLTAGTDLDMEALREPDNATEYGETIVFNVGRADGGGAFALSEGRFTDAVAFEGSQSVRIQLGGLTITVGPPPSLTIPPPGG
jgi:hypothetical protein